jgi:hypothetical protein
LPRIRTNYDQFITKSVTASRGINVTEYFEALYPIASTRRTGPLIPDVARSAGTCRRARGVQTITAGA